MCLEHIHRYRIKKDLIVYKVQFINNKSKCTSLYQSTLLPKLNTIQTAKGSSKIFTTLDNTKYIGEGFFHSFRTLKDARKEAAFWNIAHFRRPILRNKRIIIRQCIIPAKDNIVYRGKFGHSKGLASRKLIFTKIKWKIPCV